MHSNGRVVVAQFGIYDQPVPLALLPFGAIMIAQVNFSPPDSVRQRAASISIGRHTDGLVPLERREERRCQLELMSSPPFALEHWRSPLGRQMSIVGESSFEAGEFFRSHHGSCPLGWLLN